MPATTARLESMLAQTPIGPVSPMLPGGPGKARWKTALEHRALGGDHATARPARGPSTTTALPSPSSFRSVAAATRSAIDSSTSSATWV